MRRDGDDDDPRGGFGPRPVRTARELREMLRANGIEIESQPTPTLVVTPQRHEVDRGRVRAILADAGVSERELEWMVPSCPSESIAMNYAAALRRKGVTA